VADGLRARKEAAAADVEVAAVAEAGEAAVAAGETPRRTPDRGA